MADLKTASSTYPTNIDTYTAYADSTDDLLAAAPNNILSAIINIETELGIAGTGIPALKGNLISLAARLASISGADGGVPSGTVFPSTPTPVTGQMFWRTDYSPQRLYMYDGTAAQWIRVDFDGDHGGLGGLPDDDHTQYVHNTVARTISANHDFTGGLKTDTISESTAATGVTIDGVKIIDSAIPTHLPIRDVARGLVVTANTTNPAYQVDIDADELILHDSTPLPFRDISVNLTVDITASGANGLDTGTEASSTNYYVWVIYNPTTTTTAGLLSTSETAPTMPSGYTYKALVGSSWNDSGSNFNGIGIYNRNDQLHERILEIGDWNMDLISNKFVAHGVTGANIRCVSAIVRPDSGTSRYALTPGSITTAAEVDGWISSWDATLVNLDIRVGGAFDNTNFDSTSYNRGWVTIWYV